MKKGVLVLVVALFAAVLPTVAASAQDTPMCDGLPATIVGTEGPDNITGTSGRDVIVGLGGNDVIRGLAGADTICGNEGRDRILGGKQGDVIIGGDDGDKLFGDAGRDFIYGERGNDLLIGGQGDDVLDGGRGRRDRMRGRSGADVCIDEQEQTRFDLVCLAGPAVGPAFSIDVCTETEGQFELATNGLITNTSLFRWDYGVTVELLDAEANVIDEIFVPVEDVRAGETVAWETFAPDPVSGLDECVANYEVFEPLNDPAEAWEVTVDTCAAGLFGMTATGQITNVTDSAKDLAILGHVIGGDGVRYAESSLDFIEDVPAGQTVNFETLGGSEPVNGLLFCDIFVDAFEAD